jgi:hypothetical protein
MSSSSVQITEKELVERLVANAPYTPIQSLGLEVRSHGRARADVMLLANGELIAIEAKVKDWKRALGQAVLNKYCADRSYVALLDSRITPAVKTEARLHGIGLIAVGENMCRVVAKAPRNAPLESLRARVLSTLISVVSK